MATPTEPATATATAPTAAAAEAAANVAYNAAPTQGLTEFTANGFAGLNTNVSESSVPSVIDEAQNEPGQSSQQPQPATRVHPSLDEVTEMINRVMTIQTDANMKMLQDLIKQQGMRAPEKQYSTEYKPPRQHENRPGIDHPIVCC